MIVSGLPGNRRSAQSARTVSDDLIRKYYADAAAQGLACDASPDPALRAAGRVGCMIPKAPPTPKPADPLWRDRFSTPPIAKDETMDPVVNEKLVSYLESILTPQQMERVRALASGDDAPAPVAQDSAFVLNRDGTIGRRSTPTTAAQQADRERRFPHFNRLGYGT